MHKEKKGNVAKNTLQFLYFSTTNSETDNKN